MSPTESGVNLIHIFPTNAPLTLMQEQGSGCGIAAGDIDGDALPDLLISDYDHGCSLYRNLGNWKFSDITERSGVHTSNRWCGGVVLVDIDNDEDLDLYICCLNAPNLLFINRGDGTFTERAAEYGLAWVGASVMAAFGDYDRDGRLDLYLVTHRIPFGRDQQLPRNTQEAFRRGLLQRNAQGRLDVAPEYRDLFGFIDKGDGRAELAIAGQADVLFRQNADGRFSNVTSSAGIRGQDIGLAASWWDYDGDGWPDLYVANDHKSPDRLWRNLHDGAFAESAPVALPHVPLSSMGTDLGDLNNDGRIDLLATDMAGSSHARRMVVERDAEKDRWFLRQANPKQLPRNALFLASGTGRVFEAAYLAGLAATDWTWSPKFGDFDNDGWTDLWVANGMSRDYLDGDLMKRLKEPGHPGWLQQAVLLETNLAFRNQGALQFTRIESEWGLNQNSASFGAAVVDFDQDGDLDLAVMNFGAPVSLLRNRELANHRLTLRLRGTRSNRWGVGALVTATTGQGIQSRTVSLTSGFMSANEPLIHFGLGAQISVPRLVVQWPSGARQQFEQLPADRAYTIAEPEVDEAGAVPTSPRVSWLRPSTQAAELSLGERSHDDFEREPLLPWRSEPGPILARGDFDGDGDDDFYLGGDGVQAGVLGVHQADGTFQRTSLSAFEASPKCVDASAVFFEANGDGFLDLYVVSGAGGYEADSVRRLDRLYLGDGRGGFTRAELGTLPEMRDAGSVVCAADFDRDGDLDLFVGGGSVPGSYPVPGASRLFRNDRGRFTDISNTASPGLAKAGIVTGGVWSDANGDGWVDLIISTEWGPVRLFLNRHGQLEEATDSSGLGARTGFWQGVTAGDVDGDGDLDYVTANFGTNSKFHASPTEPLRLFRGDLGATGQSNHLIGYWEDGVLYPQHGRHALLAAFPQLADSHPTAQSFATATLSNLFPTAGLAGAFQVSVNTLESGVWFNDGSPHFTFSPLPVLAQLAPSFGTVLVDLDGDRNLDLAMAQNFVGANGETGPFDGGMGLVLRGLGRGEFASLPPDESGFVVPNEARGVGLLDLNRDGLADLVIGIHEGELRTFENQAGSRTPDLVPLTVRLRGRAGNPAAVGSRIELSFADGTRRIAEVYAGGTRCAPAGSVHYFPYRPELRPTRLRVRWPTGETDEISPALEDRVVVVSER